MKISLDSSSMMSFLEVEKKKKKKKKQLLFIKISIYLSIL